MQNVKNWPHGVKSYIVPMGAIGARLFMWKIERNGVMIHYDTCMRLADALQRINTWVTRYLRDIT